MIQIPKGWILIDYIKAVEIIPTVGKKIKQKNYLVSGKYPIIDQGQDFIGGYTNERENLIDSEFPVIVFGDHTRIVKLVNDKFAPGADGIKIIRPIEIFNPILFFYFTKYLSIKLPDKGYSRHFQFLKKSKIPLPPLNEQNRIVEKIEELFSELDKAKEELQKVRGQLKIYRQSVLKAAFEGKLTEDWRNINDLKPFILDTQNKDINRVYTIPNTWKWAFLADIGRVVSGGTPSTRKPEYFDGDIPWITPKDLSGYQKKYIARGRRNISSEGLKNSSAKIIPKGSIVFSSRAPIGYVAIAANQISTNQGFKNLVPYDNVFNEYVYYYLKNSKKLVENYASGTTFKEISGSKFATLPIPLCSFNEQEQIVQEIESRLSVCDKIEETVESGLIKIEHLRQSILKKAFEGKLVPQDPKDLPAEELLKLIKIEKEKIQNNSKKKVKR